MLIPPLVIFPLAGTGCLVLGLYWFWAVLSEAPPDGKRQRAAAHG
jgi:hypothetical protein